MGEVLKRSLRRVQVRCVCIWRSAVIAVGCESHMLHINGLCDTMQCLESACTYLLLGVK